MRGKKRPRSKRTERIYFVAQRHKKAIQNTNITQKAIQNTNITQKTTKDTVKNFKKQYTLIYFNTIEQTKLFVLLLNSTTKHEAKTNKTTESLHPAQQYLVKIDGCKGTCL